MKNKGAIHGKEAKNRDIEQFIYNSKIVHDNKYSYEDIEYINCQTKIELICPIHDEKFLVTPSNHLNHKTGCPICSNMKITTKEFIRRAEIIHKFRYDYSKVNYIRNNIKVEIICSVHGTFLQTPGGHLRGAGCQKCKAPGWSKTKWIEICNSKDNIPLLYIIRCFNKNENFIKIGKTSYDTSKRFSGKGHMPYSYEIIREIKGSPDFIWDKEVELHRLYKNYRYDPKIFFGGHTECFNVLILNLM